MQKGGGVDGGGGGGEGHSIGPSVIRPFVQALLSSIKELL